MTSSLKAQESNFKEICKTVIFRLFLHWFVYFLLFKDNSLKEWSYKKAVTIQTYESYNPIHAPLNIISEFFLLHWWNQRKEERQRRQRSQRGSHQPHSLRVKLVILTLYHNFACKMLHVRFQIFSDSDFY